MSMIKIKSSYANIYCRTSERSMPTMHKVLFGASIAMFLISVVHLGLVMQQVTVPLVPKPNFQTQIVLSVIQVCQGLISMLPADTNG
jgi:hypothetical protein